LINSFKNKTYRFKLGKSGEHLVCFDLLRQGYDAFLVPNEIAIYDIIVNYKNRPIKIQVKTTEKLNGIYDKSYTFRTRKTNHKGYSSKEVDIFALVIIKELKIAYLPVTNKTSAKIRICIKKFKNKIYNSKRILITGLTFQKAVDKIF